MASAIEPIPPEKPAQSLQSIGVEAKAKALSLYGLPNELMLEICVHLTIDEAFCFTATCKFLHGLRLERVFWLAVFLSPINISRSLLCHPLEDLKSTDRSAVDLRALGMHSRLLEHNLSKKKPLLQGHVLVRYAKDVLPRRILLHIPGSRYALLELTSSSVGHAVLPISIASDQESLDVRSFHSQVVQLDGEIKVMSPPCHDVGSTWLGISLYINGVETYIVLRLGFIADDLKLTCPFTRDIEGDEALGLCLDSEICAYLCYNPYESEPDKLVWHVVVYGIGSQKMVRIVTDLVPSENESVDICVMNGTIVMFVESDEATQTYAIANHLLPYSGNSPEPHHVLQFNHKPQFTAHHVSSARDDVEDLTFAVSLFGHCANELHSFTICERWIGEDHYETLFRSHTMGGTQGVISHSFGSAYEVCERDESIAMASHSSLSCMVLVQRSETSSKKLTLVRHNPETGRNSYHLMEIPNKLDLGMVRSLSWDDRSGRSILVQEDGLIFILSYNVRIHK